jgi:hypothetical protein
MSGVKPQIKLVAEFPTSTGFRYLGRTWFPVPKL